MDNRRKFLEALDVKSQCEKYELPLFQCPQFLFIVMGVITIISIVSTYFVAKKYAEAEFAVLIVLGLTTFLLVIGYAIIQSFEKLAEASRIKSEFISVTSHHLREPVSAMKWELEALEKENLNKEEALIYSGLKNQNRKILNILNDLTEAHNIENGELVLNITRFSLVKLTEEKIKEFEPYANASNIKIIFKAPPETSLVLGDLQKTKIAIDKLLDNAIRYSPSGKEINITAEKEGNHLVWRIADEGAGIPEEELLQISRKFFRSKNIYRYQKAGLGLGLYISKGLILAQKGKFGFNSTEGKGSLFWFTLPLAN